MKIDIIIPVFNNHIGTKKCIDSIYEHIPNLINKIYIHDNVSDDETIQMLKSLDYPNLEIFFSDTNVGYGKAINRSFKKTNSDLVLIQSSDTVIFDDFLTPMIETMNNNKDLGILNPNGDQYDRTSLDNYDTSKNFVESYNFSGYAFLIRRELFEKETGKYVGAVKRAYRFAGYQPKRGLEKLWLTALEAGSDLGNKKQRDDQVLLSALRLFHACFDIPKEIIESYSTTASLDRVGPFTRIV